ncbi:MAG: DedA family protein, partial [Egibacteraceae bacterium]
MPGVAGLAGMPYRRFLVYNVVGGVAWASTFTLLGYAAGASYGTVQRYAGDASLLLLAVAVLAIAVRWAVRRIAAHQDALVALGRRLAGSAPGRAVTGRWGPQ